MALDEGEGFSTQYGGTLDAGGVTWTARPQRPSNLHGVFCGLPGPTAVGTQDASTTILASGNQPHRAQRLLRKNSSLWTGHATSIPAARGSRGPRRSGKLPAGAERFLSRVGRNQWHVCNGEGGPCGCRVHAGTAQAQASRYGQWVAWRVPFLRPSVTRRPVLVPHAPGHGLAMHHAPLFPPPRVRTARPNGAVPRRSCQPRLACCKAAAVDRRAAVCIECRPMARRCRSCVLGCESDPCRGACAFISQLARFHPRRPTRSLALAPDSVSPPSLHHTIAIVTFCLLDTTLVACAACASASTVSPSSAHPPRSRADTFLVRRPGERGKLETFQALVNAKRFVPAVLGIVERVLAVYIEAFGGLLARVHFTSALTTTARHPHSLPTTLACPRATAARTSPNPTASLARYRHFMRVSATA